MKSRLNGRNTIKAINSNKLCKSFKMEKWTKIQLGKIDIKTRKIMTMAMNKELHPRNDVYRLHVHRTEKGRELIGCKMKVKAAENSLGWFA